MNARSIIRFVLCLIVTLSFAGTANAEVVPRRGVPGGGVPGGDAQDGQATDSNGVEAKVRDLLRVFSASPFFHERLEAERELRANISAYAPVLEQIAGEANVREKMAIIKVVENWNDGGKYSFLDAFLDDSNRWVRYEAGRSLSVSGHRGHVVIENRLRADGYQYREEVYGIAVEIVVAALESRLNPLGASRGTFEYQFAEAAKFGEISAEILGKIVRREFTFSADGLMVAAAEALGDVRHEAALPELENCWRMYSTGRYSSGGGPLVRAIACSLYRHGSEGQVQELIQALISRGAQDMRMAGMGGASSNDELARIYLHIGEYRKAIETFRSMILELDPGTSSPRITFFNMACAYSKSGRPELAVAYLKRAVNSGYREIDWIMEDGDLNNLRTNQIFLDFIEKLRAAEIGNGVMTFENDGLEDYMRKAFLRSEEEIAELSEQAAQTDTTNQDQNPPRPIYVSNEGGLFVQAKFQGMRFENLDLIFGMVEGGRAETTSVRARHYGWDGPERRAIGAVDRVARAEESEPQDDGNAADAQEETDSSEQSPEEPPAGENEPGPQDAQAPNPAAGQNAPESSER
ncbi:MAG: tetratricopeptide repeat protein [Planctomycetes bacterium]|nr:tetratricopeptide repeat protein [Planctomycetota bacterium]